MPGFRALALRFCEHYTIVAKEFQHVVGRRVFHDVMHKPRRVGFFRVCAVLYCELARAFGDAQRVVQTLWIQFLLYRIQKFSVAFGIHTIPFPVYRFPPLAAGRLVCPRRFGSPREGRRS